VTGSVRRPVPALALVVAVACGVACALLECSRPGAAIRAVGALVQLGPHVGVGGVSWHQSTCDVFVIDAAIHYLVLVHAESRVQKHLLERLVIDAVATATHALVHLDILAQGMLNDNMVVIDELLYPLLLVDVDH
jgi:hypothetical protein